jgi:anti-sigma factor RsiW
MSTELDDETLQRFYDGDLSPLEERAVRSRIEADPAAQRRLQELEKLSALIQLAADQVGSELDSSTLFAGIERDLAKQSELGFGERLRVVVGEWKEHRRSVVMPLAAAAAAAAVAVVSLVARDAGDDEAARLARKREVVRVADARPVEVHGTRVENVDFGRSTGTVFEIDTEGVATAVVWIADEEEESP